MFYIVKFYDGSEMRVNSFREASALFFEREDAFDIVEPGGDE